MQRWECRKRIGNRQCSEAETLWVGKGGRGILGLGRVYPEASWSPASAPPSSGAEQKLFTYTAKI